MSTAEQNAILPHLIVSDGAAAIDFYKRAFGAELIFDLPMPDGRVGHAELSIGAARFMLADEFPDLDCIGPTQRGGTTVHLAFYVRDVDAVTARAEAAGGRLVGPIKDEFYGDRVAHLSDPFGHHWTIHTRKEEVSVDEMRRRMTAGEQS